jgi:hypothetical protein
MRTSVTLLAKYLLLSSDGMETNDDKLLQLFVILHYYGAKQALDAVFGLKNYI